ncbi:conserved hypothetical protein [Gammaproteobacteria bacterium]
MDSNSPHAAANTMGPIGLAMNSRLDALDFVNELEERFRVERWRTEGFHVWPLIRNEVLEVVDTAWSGRSFRPLLARLVQDEAHRLVRERSRSSLGTPVKGARPVSRADVLFLCSVRDRVLLEGRWFHRYVDPYLSYLVEKGVSSQVLQAGTLYRDREPIYYPEHWIDIGHHVHTYFCIHRNSVTVSLIKPDEAEYRSFLEHIADRTGARQATFALLGLERMRDRLSELQVYVDCFRDLISASHSRFCFLVGCGSPQGRAICIACAQLGVVSIDLQHGVLGDTNPAYGHWNRLPERGYEMIPAQFWCWSDEEKMIIDTWAGRSGNVHQAVVVGYPWLAMWLEREGPVRNVSVAAERRLAGMRGEVNILYTFQPIEGFGYRVPEAVVQAIDESPPGWKWWIRLHPDMLHDMDNCRQFLGGRCANGRFEVEHATILPLPLLLGYMQAHVTQWSSVVLEAMTFGVPSILLHPQGRDLFRQPIRLGCATIWEPEQGSLTQCIAGVFSRKCHPVTTGEDWRTVVDQWLTQVQ